MSPPARRRLTPHVRPPLLLDGLAFGESPRWHDGRLWLCDWGAGEVLAVDLAGRREVITEVPAFPFCIHAYVNGIGFDFGVEEDAASGVLAVVAADGSTRQVVDGLAFLNGMVVTTDGATLIVAESYGQRLTAFDIDADGGLSNRRTWAELDGSAPDGICLDAEGAIWFGDVPNRRAVRVREGGDVLQVIGLDRGCFACALGGDDGRTLFLVARTWGGAEEPGDDRRTGQVLTTSAPAPATARPVPRCS